MIVTDVDGAEGPRPGVSVPSPAPRIIGISMVTRQGPRESLIVREYLVRVMLFRVMG